MTLTEKILTSHLVGRDALPQAGEDIAIKIDQTLTQDATGTMAYLQFETIGVPRVKTELSVSYVDHNTLQTDYRNMDDHRYLQSAAARYGLYFSRAGNGICHQVHLEHFGKPGKTLLGSDSHTPTGGGLGMIAIGAGGLDVAVAMAGGAFHLARPRVIGVELTGELTDGVGAKDVILEVLRRESVKGGVGAVYEYFGSGVTTLTVPQRATITNMGAELGATCSVFPSDGVTKNFLEAMGRGGDWTEQKADNDAVYDKVIMVDLSALRPLAACPHSPDNVKPVAELAGKKVTQVVIGSCTNSSLDDLTEVANIVRGHHIAPGVEAGIAPGSRATLTMAASSGVLQTLIEAGFRILESACGPCIGMGFAPNSGGVSLRTFNRNFKGRSGTADAEVYLVSPQTAAASAISGVITTAASNEKKASAPCQGHRVIFDTTCAASLDKNCIEMTTVSNPYSDEGMIIPPLDETAASKVEILRGPNIKPCPPCPPCADVIAAPVMLKAGDNVSTDDIMPAGTRVLPYRSNIPEIAKFAFERLDSTFYERVKARSRGKVGDRWLSDGVSRCIETTIGDCIVVGGENWGQGSSREHAALAPMYLGVRAILVKSFARIHKANLVNYGILPLLFQNPADYDIIEQGAEVKIERIKECLVRGEPLAVKVGGMVRYAATDESGYSPTKEIMVKCDVGERERQILLAGGRAAYTRQGGN